jgi:CheY-like chemotaxis protein
LTFYEEVQELDLIESGHHSQADADAEYFTELAKIVKRYLDKECPQMIDIPQSMAQKLIDIKNGGIPNITRFAASKELEAAQKEIVGMIAGHFPRFQNSVIFKQFLKVYAKGVASAKENGKSIRDMRTNMISTVLLCEKHELTGLVLAHIFASKGYVVTIAEDGALALKMLAQDSFDIVLVNYDMPEKDAVQIIQEHKQMGDTKNNKAKFICMISDSGGYCKKTANSVGYHATLKKPFNMSEFTKAKVAAGKKRKSVFSSLSDFIMDLTPTAHHN